MDRSIVATEQDVGHSVSSLKRTDRCEHCDGSAVCILRCNLGDADLDNILQSARRHEYSAGERLFHEGDEATALYIVCSGEIGLEKIGLDGDTLQVRRALPGSIMGARALLSDKRYSASAVVRQPSVIHRVPGSAFLSSAGSNATLMFALANALADEVRVLSDLAWSMAYRSAEERVAETVYLLAMSEDTDDIACRRRDVAERSGLALETTVRVLKKLEANGHLKLARGHIYVEDREGLADIAQLV